MVSFSVLLLMHLITSCEKTQDDIESLGKERVQQKDTILQGKDTIADAPVNPVDQNVNSEKADYYVATNGDDNNPGTIDQPFASWQKAVDMARPGDLVYIRGGVYRTSKTTGYLVNFTNKKGSDGNYIRVWAYPGEKPILNMDDKNLTGYTFGIYFFESDFIHLKGLRITGMRQTSQSNFNYGLSMEGYSDHNIIENCEFDHVCVGCKIDNQAGDNNDNLILNCDAHHCNDPLSVDASGTADGFICNWGTASCKNTYKGCRSWWVTDDGFDGFKCNGTIIYDSCWSFRNGYIPGTMTYLKGATGFKMGYDDNISNVTRVYNNCLAFDVTEIGYSLNDANSIVHLYNSIAWRNGTWGIRLISSGSNLPHITKYCTSFDNSTRESKFDYTAGTNSINDNNSWNGDAFYAPGSWNDTHTSGNSFISLDTTGVTGPRQANGSLPDLDFLKSRNN